MDFALMAAMAALVWKLIDFLRDLAGGDWVGARTQAIVWGAGILVIWLGAQTQWAHGVSIGDRPLDALNMASLVMIGLGFSSAGSAARDSLSKKKFPKLTLRRKV